MDEQHILNLMKTLNITREEAIELDEYDDDVNHGKKTEYDLTPEQEAVARKMTRVENNAKHKNVARERKPNVVKESIIAELANFFKEDAQSQVFEDVIIANKSRKINFSVNGVDYTIDLIEHRKKKE